MADIGTIVPAATRVEPADVLVGNVVEHSGDTRDIPITALRRSNANHDIESINNSVRLKTNGVVGVQLVQSGDFSVDTSGIFYKKSSGFLGLGNVLPTHKLTIGIGRTEGGITTQNTQSVSTATTILTGLPNLTYSCVVVGSDVGVDSFTDLVILSNFGATFIVISSNTVFGAPAVRTYSRSGNNLQVAMASGTYDITVTATITGNPL